jgi:hypothetical protein
MGDQDEIRRLYTAARSIIRSKAWRLCRRWNLRFHEREDLEQELWLALLIHWNQQQTSDEPIGLSSNDGQWDMATLRHHLVHQVEYIVASMIYSDAFWQSIRPRRELLGGAWLEEVLMDRESLSPQQIDLRLDVAEVLAQLPPGLRQLCDRLMEPSVSPPSHDGELVGRSILMLRHALRSFNPHESR